MAKALITGITGQDGAYLAKHLLDLGYQVFGAARRNSNYNTQRLQILGIEKDIKIREFELLEESNIRKVLEDVQPDEIYNLGAQSHVQVSFEVPEYTAEVDGIGTLRFLDAIKDTGIPATKFIPASTAARLRSKSAGRPNLCNKLVLSIKSASVTKSSFSLESTPKAPSTM